MLKATLSFALITSLSLVSLQAQDGPYAAHTFLHRFATPNSSVPTGTFPSQIKHAYGFDQILGDGTGQVIALVDAYDYPQAEADLGVFSNQFGLPACTSANGCFSKVYGSGTVPATNGSWAQEMALDIQWAHAIAPGAKIMLAEAASNGTKDLLLAVYAAVKAGATVVSMSWGGAEISSESTLGLFQYTGTTFVASSGDSGNGPSFPAAVPTVIAVGGTTLRLNSGNTIVSETAWSGSGGGISVDATEPAWQNAVQSSGKRGIPDVAYDADPSTGFPVYDSFRYQGASGWLQFGGTSDAAPQWAGLIAVTNQLRKAAGKGNLVGASSLLYSVPASNYNDVTSGTNGSCGAICTAGAGWDFVTGFGSPKANLLIPSLVALP